MGAGMLVTGLVTDFPALVATQMLWGLALDVLERRRRRVAHRRARPARAQPPGVLTASARWEQIGAALGLVGFGALAWVDRARAPRSWSRGSRCGCSGSFVALRFSERHFTPTRSRRLRESVSIFRRGVELARRDHQILLVFAATLLVNGAARGIRSPVRQAARRARLSAKRPIRSSGSPALGLVTLALGALALRVVEARIDGVGRRAADLRRGVLRRRARPARARAAPDVGTGMAGVLLVDGHRVHGDPLRRRDLGQPAHHERRARDACSRSSRRPSTSARSRSASRSASSRRRPASRSRCSARARCSAARGCS